MGLSTQTRLNMQNKQLAQQGVTVRSLCPGNKNAGCEILIEAKSGQPNQMCPNCFAAFQKSQREKRKHQ